MIFKMKSLKYHLDDVTNWSCYGDVTVDKIRIKLWISWTDQGTAGCLEGGRLDDVTMRGGRAQWGQDWNKAGQNKVDSFKGKLSVRLQPWSW